MKNPFIFLKKDKQIDAVELERAVDHLYQHVDETKFIKPLSEMQDHSRDSSSIQTPSELKVFSEVTRVKTMFKQSYVRAKWGPVSGVARYEAELQSMADAFNSIRETAHAQATWEAIPPGTSIKVRVRSISDVGGTSEWSDWVEHSVESGKYRGVGPEGPEVTKMGKWVHASVDKVKRRDHKDHLGFEWHASTTEGFTPDSAEERENLIVNGDFEQFDSDDEVAGWTESGTLGSDTYSTDYAKGGEASCLIDIDSGGDYLYQDVTLDPESTYQITGYVRKHASDAVQRDIQLYLAFSSGAASETRYGTITGDDCYQTLEWAGNWWRKFRFTVTTDDTETQTAQLRIRYAGTATGQFYADRIRVRKLNGTFRKFTFGNNAFWHEDHFDQVHVLVRGVDVNGQTSGWSESSPSESAFGLAGLASKPNKPTSAAVASTGGNPRFFVRKGYAKITWTNPSTFENEDTLAEDDVVGYKVYWTDSTDYDNDVDSWHSRFIPSRQVTFSSPYAIIRGLTRGKAYRFKVSIMTALLGTKSESDLSTVTDEATITESGAPGSVTTLVSTSADYRGTTGGRFARFAYETVGWNVSDLTVQDAAFIHLRYWPTSYPALKHTKILKLKNLDSASAATLGATPVFGLDSCVIHVNWQEFEDEDVISDENVINVIDDVALNVVDTSNGAAAADTTLYPGGTNIVLKCADNKYQRYYGDTEGYRDVGKFGEGQAFSASMWIYGNFVGVTNTQGTGVTLSGGYGDTHTGLGHVQTRHRGWSLHPITGSAGVQFHIFAEGTPDTSQLAQVDYTFANDKWYFICATYDGTHADAPEFTANSFNIYIGSEDDTTPTQYTVGHDDLEMIINSVGAGDWAGVNTGGRRFQVSNYALAEGTSKIDHARCYSKVLTSADVNTLFSNELGNGGTDYAIARIGGLLQNTVYDWDYRLTGFNLELAGDFTDGDPSFTTDEDAVIDMNAVKVGNDIKVYLYQLTRGLFKRQRYKLHVEFGGVIDEYPGTADRYEVKIARKRDKWAFWRYTTHILNNETEGSVAWSEEGSWPVLYPPKNITLDSSDTEVFVNIRAWALGKPGTPAAGANTWNPTSPNTQIDGTWIEATNKELPSDDLPSPVFPASHPSVEHVALRWYKIKAVDADYDYPDNFAYFTYHAVINSEKTNYDFSVAGDDRRKTLVGRSIKTDEHDEVVRAPYYVWNPTTDERDWTDAEDLYFIVVIWTWQNDGTGVYAVKYADESTAIAGTGVDEDPEAEGGTTVWENIYNEFKKKATVRRKFSASDTTIYCDNYINAGGTIRFEQNDILQLESGRRFWVDRTEKMLVTTTTAINKIVVTRGYDSTTAETGTRGNKLVKVGKLSSTTLYNEPNPTTGEMKTVRAVTDGSGNITTTTIANTSSDGVSTFATFANDDGVRMWDTGNDHYLGLAVGENLAANKTLTFVVGDDRTLTLNGNVTLNDWFDQSVKTTASPTFNDLNLNMNNDNSSGPFLNIVGTIAHDNTLTQGMFMNATFAPTEVVSGAKKLIAISGKATLGATTNYGSGTLVAGLSFGVFGGFGVATGSTDLKIAGLECFGANPVLAAVTCKNTTGVKTWAVGGIAGSVVVSEYGAAIHALDFNVAGTSISCPIGYGLFVDDITSSTANIQIALEGSGAGSGIWFNSPAIGTATSYAGTHTKYSGTHTAATHATVLTDSTQAWTNDELIGDTVTNVTDGSSGVITDNNGTTITVTTLAGGTDDEWKAGDVYTINAGHATILTDSDQSWTNDELIGYTILNTTDSSSGVITDNTSNTITVAELTGGSDNEFQANDAYTIDVSARFDTPRLYSDSDDSFVIDSQEIMLEGEISVATVEIDNTDSTYTAGTNNERMIVADATSGNIIVALPASATIDGKRFSITRVDSSAYTVTVDGNSAEEINGVTTQTLVQYDTLDIAAIDGGWIIV